MRIRTCLWAFAASFAAVGCGSPGEPPSSYVGTMLSFSPRRLSEAALGSPTKSPGPPEARNRLIIGENRTFDHLFATYKAKSGQFPVDNLPSLEGNRQAGRIAGPQFLLDVSSEVGRRRSAEPLRDEPRDRRCSTRTLPPPLSGGPATARRSRPWPTRWPPRTAWPPATTSSSRRAAPGSRPGRSTRASRTPREPAAGALFDHRSHDDRRRRLRGRARYTASTRCGSRSIAAPRRRTVLNPSGCREDLFPWVEVTVGAGTNGLAQPAGFNDASTGEGSTAMGFYNMAKGDIAYTKSLVDAYAMSDNFHQAVEGGTGANHVMLGTADAIYFSDGEGNAAVPPDERDREPRSAARHQQLVHGGRVRVGGFHGQPDRRGLVQRVRRYDAARRRVRRSAISLRCRTPSTRGASRDATTC